MFTNENPFSDSLWKEIKSTVETCLDQPGPHYAAFDADGTLWPLDAGETFFQYQIKHCQLKGLPPDPWAYYWELKDIDAPASCLWLAQINKGQTLEQVRAWADDCFNDAKAFPVHHCMYQLVQWLKSVNVQPHIVTASIKWAVEPLARRIGLTNENVLGIETHAKDGILTDQGLYPLTHGKGKAEVFLQSFNSIAPVLGAGNTITDSYLIDISKGCKLAIASAKAGEHNYESEMKLQNMARENSWLTHSFF